MALAWHPLAVNDRGVIFDYIAADNPQAAIDLDEAFEASANSAAANPKLYKVGRKKGTREIVVRPNYIMVYRIVGKTDVEILRVLHAARQWP